ncbi:MAG: hypothetical protein JSS13_06010 [Proteobacteria bacterium]|nr:hypothetical protein [Pseudomonadota bacterium]
MGTPDGGRIIAEKRRSLSQFDASSDRHRFDLFFACLFALHKDNGGFLAASVF